MDGSFAIEIHRNDKISHDFVIKCRIDITDRQFKIPNSLASIRKIHFKNFTWRYILQCLTFLTIRSLRWSFQTFCNFSHS